MHQLLHARFIETVCSISKRTVTNQKIQMMTFIMPRASAGSV